MELPQVQLISQNKSDVLLSLTIPAALKYCEGHFPNHPVVPGAVLIGWVAQLAHRYLNCGSIIKQMDKVKFLKSITTPMQMELTITFAADTHRIHFQYTINNDKYVSGQLMMQDTNV